MEENSTINSKRIIQKIAFFLFAIILLFVFAGLFYKKRDSIKKYVSISSFRSGNSQMALDRAFNKNFPKKDAILKVLSQIKYSVLKSGNGTWDLGTDGYLFHDDISKSWAAGLIGADIGEERLERFVKDVRVFQDLILSKGKDFVFLFTPTKAQIYPEKLPWNFRILAKKYSSLSDVYGQKVKALFEKNGINFVDLCPVIEEQKQSGLLVYPKTGHHWTLLSSAQALDGVFSKNKGYFSHASVPRLRITDVISKVEPVDIEIPISMGLFFYNSDGAAFFPVIEYDAVSDDSLFLYGTSFGYGIMEALFREDGKKAFDKGYYSMYNAQFYSYGDGEVVHVEYDVSQKMEEKPHLEKIEESKLVMMEAQLMLTSAVLDAYNQFFDYANNALRGE